MPIVHFIFGLADRPDAFGFSHFLAVRAAHVHLRPSRLLLHYHHLPFGEWWPPARELLELAHVELATQVFDRPLRHAAHRADVLRLKLLIQHGGIYLDLDVIVLRPMAALLADGVHFAVGREGDEAHGGAHGLCNAVLLARPNASFARRWLEEYRSFGSGDGDDWSEHSVQRPVRLAQRFPAEVRVLPYDAFFWPDWDEDNLRRLLLERTDPLAHLQRPAEAVEPSVGYAVHLYSSLAKAYVLDQWSPEYVASVPATLNCLLQASLAPLPALPPLLGGLSRNCSCRPLLAPRRRAAAGQGAVQGAMQGAVQGESTAEPSEGAAAVIGHWPLRRPAASPGPHLDAARVSARLLVDVSGHCNHGWVYSACEGEAAGEAASFGCWWATESSGGADSIRSGGEAAKARWSDGGTPLSFSSPLEAFIPLPAHAVARGELSVAWWAQLHSRRDGCGGRVPFWTLSFDDGAELRAYAQVRATDCC